MIGTLDSSFEQLRTALNLMDFSVRRTFMNIKNIYRNPVLDFIENEINQEIYFNNETVMMYMEKERALEFDFEVPEGLEIRSLSCDDGFKVNFHWPHASPGSEDFLKYCIKFNTSVGLYNENNELLSWCLSHDFRLLLNLFTDPNHLRKGYAEIVTKAISKKMAGTSNCDITASIVVNNKKSLSLFRKLGFKLIDRNSWIGVEGKVKK